MKLSYKKAARKMLMNYFPAGLFVSDEEQGLVLQLEAEVGERRDERDGVLHQRTDRCH